MTAPAPPTDGGERRGLVLAGLAFFGVLALLIGLVAVFGAGAGDERETTATTESCAPDDAACRAAQQSGERPGIIPKPGEGHAPDDPGEPGGWAQVALFFVLVLALGVIVALVVRSTRRAAGRRTPDPDAVSR
ncbi:MAG TPA: hypothetical protein VFU19_17970 [Iamia sp.]|nr:hypothetical protein [Iamia sp.]